MISGNSPFYSTEGSRAEVDRAGVVLIHATLGYVANGRPYRILSSGMERYFSSGQWPMTSDSSIWASDRISRPPDSSAPS